MSSVIQTVYVHQRSSSGHSAGTPWASSGHFPGTFRAGFGQEFLKNGCNLLQYKEITPDQSVKNGSKYGDYKLEMRFSKNYSCPLDFWAKVKMFVAII
ncbi:MAG: hypothetical protein EHM58_15615 [Ignavibacteriae bacterium]|nr:MAG: hypothetical protein EHM58_15615 [Ignavibacteriota bacterium]